ncbi:MAG: BamA/TamA family outer membrane protein [Cyclobacteriaceae bacterium]|nr:BamA/TamA family outer membrane protein [Cyclobacteriaceae bacterium]
MRGIIFTLVILLTSQGLFGQFRNRRDNQDSANELNYANPKEYQIAAIEIRGLKILDSNALVSLTGLRIGDRIKIPGDEISGAIRKLWNHGLVGDVNIVIDKIVGDQVYLGVELAELPRLTGFTFEGVSQTKETELKEDLNLYRGRVVTDAIVRKTQLTVAKNYQTQGFLNADVKVIKVRDSVNLDGVRLRIVVDKKEKVRINQVIFVGNEEVTDGRLKGKLKKTGEKVRFTLFRKLFETAFGITPKKAYNFIAHSYNVPPEGVKEFLSKNVKLNVFKSAKYITADFEEDKKKVVAYYNTRGYRDAQILSDSIADNGDNTINLFIKLNEGNKYYFRNIEWKGNYIYTDRILNSVLAINKGDTYNKELIDKKVNFNPKGMDISGLYMDDGYLFFRVDPVEIRVENDSIDIEMRIFEGDQATISKVTFSGNDRTSDHVIRRELSTVPGQKFRRSDLIRTQQQLAQMGYFDPEKVTPNYFPNPADGTVDIDWSLTERSNDQIELSGGWGGYYGFIGTLGVTLNNFSVKNMMKGKFTPIPVGDGQRLSVRMQANGKQYQNYSFSFTEPWLGGKKPNSFTISLNQSILRTRAAEDRNGDGVIDYYPGFRDDFNSSIHMQGITVGLGKRLNWPDNYFVLSSYLAYQRYLLNNYYDMGQGFRDGVANNVNVNFVIARNSIDNPMYPKSGSTLSVSATFTPPHSLYRNIDYNTALPTEKYKRIEYHKWMIDTKYYLNIFDKFVIEASAHFGILGRYNHNINVGPFERFWMGGSGLAGQNFVIANDIISLRGYEDNSLIPPFNYAVESVDGIKGGIVYDKFGMELRYPVTQSEAATIYGFIFAEGGNNWYRYEDFNPFKMYRSSGVGARIFMPAFGLIGISWGYGFDSLPGNTSVSGSQFHFTIGQQIR